MNPKRFLIITGLFLLFIVFGFVSKGWCDDTCIFEVTVDDVPPYIVLLLDNGAEMEQIQWPEDYKTWLSDHDGANFAPADSKFTNTLGYVMVKKNVNSYWLRPIQENLEYDPGSGIDSSSNTFTITIDELAGTTREVTLPYAPSTTADADGVIDNARYFRYSKNYLDWLFYTDGMAGGYTGNGLDDPTTIDVNEALPAKTRFHAAKLAIMQAAILSENKARFGVYNFTANAEGGSNVQPLAYVVQAPVGDPSAIADPPALTPDFVNNINTMQTVTYSPLAEGLATVGGYFGSPSSLIVEEYCGKLFALVISPGVSSEDATPGNIDIPNTLDDYDSDGQDDVENGTVTISGTSYTVPLNTNGTTYLDDVAAYLYDNDIVDYRDGFQRVNTFTLGFMGDEGSKAFLKNTANNGNGIVDPSDPKYLQYYFEADDPAGLAGEIKQAIDTILEETTVFTAPVVPVTNTYSGDRVYMALFKPKAGNFWEGNLAKFGLVADGTGKITIKGEDGNDATYPNGALKEFAVPYWETQDWADSIDNASRDNIYTFTGTITNGTAQTIIGTDNVFSTANGSITAAMLGDPVRGKDDLINYIRGADVLDEDSDGNTTENRSVITGDILHSEPTVVQYNLTGNTDSEYYNSETGQTEYYIVFYGSNDGMLHAVKDSIDIGDTKSQDGSELWAFIPPDLLPKLKDLLEGEDHPYYVDASPRVWISGEHDNAVNTGDQAILVFGERSGGDNYWALDISDPTAPTVLWNIAPGTLDFGETWSEPVFAKVKTSDADATGTDVMIVGGGYSADNSKGKFVTAINIQDGSVVRTSELLDYSVPSSVNAVEINNNDFIDKIYVGDMGGRMLRFGKFAAGDPFPVADENINDWTTTVLFQAGESSTGVPRKIMYPPAVTLERDFDLVFFGTGDRNDACNEATSDQICAVMDDHTTTTRTDSDLKNAAEGTANISPDDDEGYYLDLAAGEKVLGKGTVFNKVFYITSFTPGNDDPCMPGGAARLYALDYLTGQAVIDFNGDSTNDFSKIIGGGIPSRPIIIIPPVGDPQLLVSVGSTNPDENSEDTNAGIVTPDTLFESKNFFYLWWKDWWD